MTSRELAEAAAVDRAHLLNIEAGRRNAGPDVVMRLASALKVAQPAILSDPNQSPDQTAAAVDVRQSSTAEAGPVRPHPASVVGAAQGGAA